MHILRKYYNLCTEILKDEFSFVPTMKITNTKSYNGQINQTDGKITFIQLSQYSLGSGFAWEDEDIEEAIRVVCHELAHIKYWNHNASHRCLTNIYTRKVINTIGLKNSPYYNNQEGQ